MLSNIEKLLDDFVKVANISGFDIDYKTVVYEAWPAPHKPKSLPVNKQAVYVFSMPTSTKKVLKVGKVGSKSNARFLSQHYNPNSSKSNLSSSILKHSEMRLELGVGDDFDTLNIGSWVKENVDRENFYIESQHGKLLLSLLEIFLQCRLKPIFEG
ncbi:MAG: hypothetical protein GY755_20835 [Chloroflexi bacterium]|nr:hypothetical protein [Chloroflexota bacterium]